MVIIYTNFVDIEYLMFHLNGLKIIRLLVLEKKILWDFTIYGHGSHLGHVTKTILITFCPPC